MMKNAIEDANTTTIGFFFEQNYHSPSTMHHFRQQQQQAQPLSTTDEEQLFSPTQQVTLALIPVFSGFLSMVGSCLLLYLISMEGKNVQQEQRKRKSYDHDSNNANSSANRISLNRDEPITVATVATAATIPMSAYQRIMIGLSVSDMIGSLRVMTTTFVLPSDTIGVWKTFGNTTTCSAQGFVGQFSLLLSMLYTTSLSIFFFLSIVRENKSAKSTIERIEPILHAIPIVLATITAIVGLVLNAYNHVPTSVFCWIAPYPTACVNITNDIECTRGQNYKTIRIIVAIIPLILCFIVVAVCMLGIYISVKRQIQTMEFWARNSHQRVIAFDSSALTASDANISCTTGNSQSLGKAKQQNKNKMESEYSTRRLYTVRTQAQLYISVFIMVYVWNVIGRIMEYNDTSGRNNSQGDFYVSVLSLIFYPSQGFFNFFIYIRPRYMHIRATHSKISVLNAMRILFRLEPEQPIHATSEPICAVKQQCSDVLSVDETGSRLKDQTSGKDGFSVFPGEDNFLEKAHAEEGNNSNCSSTGN